MPTRKKTSEADAAALGLVIVAVLAILSAGIVAVFFLLRLPLRRCTKGNSAVPLAYFGIVTIIIGLLLGAYQAISGDATLSVLGRLTLSSWAVFIVGSTIYLLGLFLVSAYKRRLASLRETSIESGRSGTLSAEMFENMRSQGRRIGLSSSDMEIALRDADSINSLALIHRGLLPSCDPPQNIFLQVGEEAFLFRPCIFYEDKQSQMRYTQGSTTYWRVSQNLTLAPTSRVSKTMTVTELMQQDQGQLLFTSKRVRFHGDKNDFDFWLSGITGIDEYSNGIQLHYEGKRKRQIFSMDSLSAQLFAEMIRKSAEARQALSS